MWIEVALYAALALFILARYRSVLGQRPEQDVRPKPAAVPTRKTDNVITLPPRDGRAGRAEEAPSDFAPSLAATLERMQELDPAFTEKTFLKGAKAAFSMIVTAYATGDRETLKNLLSPDVLAQFEAGIEARAAAGHTLDFTLEQIVDADIVKARLDNTTALVTVELVSLQQTVTRDAEQTVVDGDEDSASEVRDVWTFSRDLSSRNPNWLLVATHSL